jgi:hypothetical protein
MSFRSWPTSPLCLPLKTTLTVKSDGAAYVVSVTAIPGGVRAAAKLTFCERDALVALAKATRRMTGTEILAAMDSVGVRWSEVALWRSLSHLVKLGRLHRQQQNGAARLPTRGVAAPRSRLD